MTGPEPTQGTPRKILLATDLSCRCDRALDRAVSLARQWDARLLVVHVLESSGNRLESRRLRDLPSWRRPPDRVRLVEEQIRRDMREELENVAVRVEEGDPAIVVDEVARAEQCDVIVTGVARDETLGRFFLGSTVDQLLRRSPIPVLVVKNRTRRPYRKVVAATDFSDPSRHALEAAARLFPQAELSLFHGFEVPFAGFLERERYEQALMGIKQETCARFLDDSAIPAEKKKRITVLFEYGVPDILLKDYVISKDVDVVAIGTHGRSGVFEALIGSMAKRILEYVPSDILVVRGPQAADPK